MVFISCSTHIPFVEKVLLAWLVCLWEILLLLMVSQSSFHPGYTFLSITIIWEEKTEVCFLCIFELCLYYLACRGAGDGISWCKILLAFLVCFFPSCNRLIFRRLIWLFHCNIVKVCLLPHFIGTLVHIARHEGSGCFRYNVFGFFYVFCKSYNFHTITSIIKWSLLSLSVLNFEMSFFICSNIKNQWRD